MSIIKYSMRGAVLALSAFTTLVAASTIADAARIAPLKVANWNGGAYTHNKNGRFSHCALSAKYKNGMTFFISVSKNKNWNVGFSKPSWRLEVGTSQAVRFNVDDGPSYSGRATARTSKLTLITLPKSKRLFNQFRFGQRFYVQTRRGRTSFDLTDAGPALNALVKCARHYRQAEENKRGMGTDPFAQNSQPKSGSNSGFANVSVPRPGHLEEAFSAVTHLLAKSGVRMDLVRREENPAIYVNNDIAWKMNGMIGTLRVLSNLTASPEEIRTAIRTNDKKRCEVGYVSYVITRGNPAVTDFFSACPRVRGAQIGQSGMVIHYTLMPRREGGYYLMSVMGNMKDHRNVRELGTHLRNNAVALNAKGSVPRQRTINF